LLEYPTPQSGAVGTVIFDWKSTWHAARSRELVLTLGYNTAIFSVLYRIRGVPNVINMDGLEWKRGKWSRAARLWLFANERSGCLLGSHLIADHPEIEKRLAHIVRQSKVTMIPYGADYIRAADEAPLAVMGLRPRSYTLVVARPEPENSILEIVRAFSRERRSCQLVLLGGFDARRNAYHRRVMESASDEVSFLGAIYEKDVVSALRKHCRLYVHGHSVGGTNPSLVEAMGGGSPILAHDNLFNRWVAGPAARFFSDEDECARRFEELLHDESCLAAMRAASERRFLERFTWERVLAEYEALFEKLF
jgi:glycosyltransferase involved in cell wall biosynthesis